ncbi:DEAD/DEAH box helicase [Shewanella sp. Isolate7]|uniref:DEAD/DEAH box helicase n=1 Tax=Shewanella sp. Isolate7 TaxID=2908528 RepID=UPI001EFE230C|nr:DEAD/DEAH box helicase [Shewanella sp. Isolate7]MCG9721017.1 DEAD/DEAH box helicase [Shewanella sp. Isolate7]
MLFSQLSLPAPLQQALEALAFREATQIQAEAIPLVLGGGDLMASAQTGTGKTAAFALPILAHLLEQEGEGTSPVSPKALVLVPTRELAVQVHQGIVALARFTSLSAGLVYGGVSIDAQCQQLAKGVELIVATPGRLLDLHRRGAVKLDAIAHLVFDEADRMLDMGFADEIAQLLALLPSERQTLLFSATLDDKVLELSHRWLSQPKRVAVSAQNSASKDVEQRVYAVDSERKFALLSHLINKGDWQRVLVFSRKKVAADKLAARLSEQGIAAKAFHGDLGQGAREQVLGDFRKGDVKVLVATDVAARGIDIESLDYVVNYELPYVVQDYVHRIGRTGRAGKQGVAVTLYCEEDALLLEEIEALLDKRLPQQWLPGFEPDLTKADPNPRRHGKAAQKRRAKRRGQGGRR